MVNKLIINDELYLDQISDKDVHALAEQISNKKIHEHTLQIPYPYQLSDAVEWVKFVELQKQEVNSLVNWTIRYQNKLIGGIGQHLKYPDNKEKDEIGYWLGEAYWGRGIMTGVLKFYCDYLFNTKKMCRLEAPIFKGNIASQSVLKKNHFIQESILEKAFEKNDQVFDAILFVKEK